MLHDVINDVGRRVIDPTRLAYLGFVLNDDRRPTIDGWRRVTTRLYGCRSSVVVRIYDADDLAEELLVHLPKYLDRHHVELVRVRVVKVVDNLPQHLIAHLHLQREGIGVLVQPVSLTEVK